ncbi:MAG: TetR/AcrR family transcriptional regulator, partial [Gammaproteobacteria bacterium]|nr:TetR/AcrR family transcriptional regulator [Gammaproteobacteria bacterium]
MSKTSKRQTGKKPDADILSGADKRPDGRLLRTERSRQLIIDALHDLINEGVLQPTAQTVAERAGVGIRTVFRHFADMETLF